MRDLIDKVKEQYRLQQIDSEWIQFLNIVKSKSPCNILEIGTASGASALTMSHFADCLITIDTSTPDDLSVFDKCRDACEFHRIVGNSHGNYALKHTKRFLHHRKVDVLFIDGDHSYEGAKFDFDRYSKFVAPGGIIALHDIVEFHDKDLECDVYKLWNELKGKYNTYEIKHGTSWAGIGIVKW